MSDKRKLQARANKQMKDGAGPLKADHCVIRSTTRPMADCAETYNSKNNKRSRIQRFLRWLPKFFSCTSSQTPNESEQNTIRLPNNYVPTNHTATSPYIETSPNLSDQVANNSAMLSSESYTRDTPNVQSNSRSSSNRSRIININESTNFLTNSTCDKNAIITTTLPKLKTSTNQLSETQLPKIHHVGTNRPSSKSTSQSPEKILPSIITSKSLPDKSNSSIIDEKTYRSIQILANRPECLRKPAVTTRSLEEKSKRTEKIIEPQIHNSQSVEVSSRLVVESNKVPERSVDITTKFIPGRCGLKNLGNTCFMNSALQCISNVSDLTNYITKHGLSSSINVNNSLGTQGKVAIAYEQLIKEMWSGNTQSVSPSMLKKHVSELFPRFTGYGQQDSHEFLNALLDALHEDLRRDSSDAYDSLNADETSIISDIFHGQIRSTVTCDECQEPFYSYDSISFVALPIPDIQEEIYHGNQSGKKVKPSINLQQCFDLFLKPEILNGANQWFCEKCDRLTDAERKLDLWTLPNILIIQLKRFSYDLSNNNKTETFIDYPIHSLDLNSFMNGSNHQIKNYDLIAVSAHTGSLVSGHYTAYAKNYNNQQWYHFDDATVRDANESAAQIGNAYILVYCKQSS